MTTVTLPPGPRLPRFAQGLYTVTMPRRGLPRLRDRFGDAFSVNVPIFGRAVVISDPAQIRQLFLAGPDVVENIQPNLGRVLGPGSMFALTGEEHRRQRKLLVPPFHGRRLAVHARIAAETDAAGGVLREAVITEVQRTRPVIDLVGRQVLVDGYQLGRWTLPRGASVLIDIALLHENPGLFPDPLAFRPSRFTEAKPDLYQWIPFGGGTRRCIGAAFANMEMNVVLKTLIRDFTLEPTSDPGERWRSRGVAFAPAGGGIAVVRRRRAETASTETPAINGRNTDACTS